MRRRRCVDFHHLLVHCGVVRRRVLGEDVAGGHTLEVLARHLGHRLRELFLLVLAGTTSYVLVELSALASVAEHELGLR